MNYRGFKFCCIFGPHPHIYTHVSFSFSILGSKQITDRCAFGRHLNRSLIRFFSKSIFIISPTFCITYTHGPRDGAITTHWTQPPKNMFSRYRTFSGAGAHFEKDACLRNFAMTRTWPGPNKSPIAVRFSAIYFDQKIF